MSLKPCPFCGSEAKCMSQLQVTGHGSYDPCFWIECSNKECSIALTPIQTFMASFEELLEVKQTLEKKWNERKNVPDYQKHL